MLSLRALLSLRTLGSLLALGCLLPLLPLLAVLALLTRFTLLTRLAILALLTVLAVLRLLTLSLLALLLRRAVSGRCRGIIAEAQKMVAGAHRSRHRRRSFALCSHKAREFRKAEDWPGHAFDRSG